MEEKSEQLLGHIKPDLPVHPGTEVLGFKRVPDGYGFGSANNTTGYAISLSTDGSLIAVDYPHNDKTGDMAGQAVGYCLTLTMTRL